MKKKILVVDDHAIVRTGLAMLLGAQDGFEVVGEAADGIEAVSRARRLKPDIVIMDLMMPRKDGVAATAEITAALPECRCLVLTSFAEPTEIRRVLAAGVKGVLLKNTANRKLIAAIRQIAAGKTVLGDDVGALLADAPETPELSARQYEILEAVARGLSNADIAVALDISAESVKTHLAKLFEKLGVASRAEAVSAAFKLHLLSS